MKIVVLCGGLSNERDVSISSGTGVAKALQARGHQVVLADLFLGLPDPEADPETLFARGVVSLGDAAIATRSPELREVMALRPDPEVRVGPGVLRLCRGADMVFLALHGEEGENGKLRALLDLHGIRYTGSGYLGSALAMHKGLSKAVLRDAGIPTPPGLVLRREEPLGPMPAPKVVVKPCSGGSSVGTSIVDDPEAYAAALELAFRYEAEVLVENFIQGRELTVGVMEGKAMPVIEIIPKTGFYDYQNKYQAGATEEICPAQIGEVATARAQRLAEEVMEAMHVEAYCRVDLLWDTASDAMYVLEANTLPGMTPTSLIPQMAAAQGMDYGQLCEKIMEVSLRKYEGAECH